MNSEKEKLNRVQKYKKLYNYFKDKGYKVSSYSPQGFNIFVNGQHHSQEGWVIEVDKHKRDYPYSIIDVALVWYFENSLSTKYSTQFKVFEVDNIIELIENTLIPKALNDFVKPREYKRTDFIIFEDMTSVTFRGFKENA